MVKFSKQLELQLVPEWKSAFCDYWKLKKDLKLIKLRLQKSQNEETIEKALIQKSMLNLSMAHLTTLTRRNRTPTSSPDPLEVIKVNHQKCLSQGQVEIYKTELVELLSSNECEVVFFKGVDKELNKVNSFYASKEDEYANKMELLKRQLINLIDMRTVLEEHQVSSSYAASFKISRLKSHKTLTRFQPKHSTTSTIHHGREGHHHGREGHHSSSLVANSKLHDGRYIVDKGTKNVQVDYYDTRSEDKEFDSSGSSPELHGPPQNSVIPTHILTNYAFSRLLRDVDATFNSLYTKGVLLSSTTRHHNNLQDIIINKRKLQCARKMLRTAFAEFYRGLGLLKTFSSLNMLAFGKILKKYDKVTSRNASSPYLKALERSRLNNSNKVDHLIDEVERLFAQNFAKGDQKKALMLLKPQQKTSCHTTTYFVGLFSGWSISFLVAFIILLHFKGSQSENAKLQSYAESMYPLYSIFFLIIFHMFMYGWNVYAWRETRINYPFIFEFAPGTELRSREIFFVCTCLTMLGVASMVCHLAFYLNGATLLDPNSIPFGTLLVCFIILIFPFNVFYRGSRLFFLRCMKRILMAPFYKVIMADFFLGDQLTSQVGAIRQAQYMVCYSFKVGRVISKDANACSGPIYHQLTYVLSILPYWWRLMQCLRRWNDEKDQMQLANGGKYLSAIIAVGCKITFQYYPSTTRLVIFIVTSSLATIYQMYWDIVMDWGLLQPHSKNPWLRDQLVLKKKYLYFFSMGINCLLRFAWIQSLLHLQLGELDPYLTGFLLSLLEVFRRGHWNFYRLENEHLNNCGKYRAVKTLPLPFRDDFVASI